MGAVFAIASATTDITTARSEAVATGMRVTFAVAAVLIAIALAIAVGSRALSRHTSKVARWARRRLRPRRCRQDECVRQSGRRSPTKNIRV